METLPPGAGHPLGTDDVGYDQLGRLMVGGQTTLEVAFGAAAVAVLRRRGLGRGGRLPGRLHRRR